MNSIAKRVLKKLRNTLQKRWVILALIGAGCIGLYFYLFRFDIYKRKNFDSPEELAEYVQAPNTLWKGTFYIGDEEERSLFLHHSLGKSILTIPADLWNPPKRMTFTRKKRDWIDWYDCKAGFE